MTAVLDRAAEILADAWQPALSASYDLGRADGYLVGYRDAEREAADSWALVAADVRQRASRPSIDELRRVWTPDHRPCHRPACGGACARCIHADAWRRRGGRPYLGAAREAQRLENTPCR